MGKDKRFVEASIWEGLAVEESASYSDGWGCLPSLQFGLSPNYSRGNGGNANLLPKGLC